MAVSDVECRQTLVINPPARYNADEMRGVLGAKFLPDARTMKFNSTRADAEYPTGFLAGRPHDDLF
jgi:hypothetical protein